MEKVRITFLTVDDYVEIVDSLREEINDFFEHDPIFSVVVITATSGDLGVDLFETYKNSNQKEKAPNVIISDLSMPNGIDGDDMVMKIQKLEFNPVVFFYDGQDRLLPPQCEFQTRFQKGTDRIENFLTEIRRILLQKFRPRLKIEGVSPIPA